MNGRVIFVGQTAIVTGGAKGIGKMIAKYLLLREHNVVIIDNDLESLNVTYNEFSQMGEIMAENIDITDISQVEETVNRIIKRFGTLHIVVNNAAVTQKKSIFDMEYEDWKRLIRVNLDGVFIVTKCALLEMRRQRYGRIVNISSMAAYSGGGDIGTAHYAASKAGVIGFTRAVAKETGHLGITCNAIAPGTSRTPMTKQLLLEKESEISKNIPIGKVGEPEDIAVSVAFLASKEAGYITGHTLVVDGGRGMGSREFI